MLFSSPLFLFLFLPLVLAVYYISRPPYRNTVLLCFNLVFYGWGEPVYIFIMLFSIAVNYLFGLWVERERQALRDGRARGVLIASIIINLGILGFFKYTNFFASFFSAVSLPEILLPIGISFYTFQSMSYVIDVYGGDTRAQRNIIDFGTYISLFPQLIAGPIVRYKDIEASLKGRKENLAQFADGVRLFIVGLSKKVLIANQMGLLWENMNALHGGAGVLGAWIGIAAFTFRIYFDFSGYSDMARGLGKMFGFEFKINFDYPYISKSITEFWRRWHISLSAWFRDYVYIPLGGSRGGIFRTVINLFVVWTLTGFWHGAGVNFILWGVYYFVLLTLEKFVFRGVLEKLPQAAAHVYVMFFVMLGWVIFSTEDTQEIFTCMSALFSLRNGILTEDAAVWARTYWPLMAVSAAACLPIFRELYGKISNKAVLETVLILAALLLCTASLVSGGYNPFLYFRF